MDDAANTEPMTKPWADKVEWKQMPHRVVGIVGYAGHGKDTLADVLVTEFGYHKLAFADPLRAFCADLFGLTPMQMTDRLLKEMGLCDHVWPFGTRFQFRTRLARPLAQLTRVPQAVVEAHMSGMHAPDPSVSIAGGLPISRLCRQVSDRIATYIEPLIFVGVNPLAASRPSPRVLLQTIGTEVFRAISPMLWANAWMLEAQRHDGFVVAPDVRFASEIDALNYLGGHAVRVDATGRLGPATGAQRAHPSEASIAKLPVSRIFTNDGTMSELKEQVCAWAHGTLLSVPPRPPTAGDPA
jgi:hypothetical protein